MKKIIFLVTIFFSFPLFSQEVREESKTETDEIIDSLLEEDEVLNDLIKSISKFNFLYLSINYSNKTYFSGRDVGVDQFNITPQLTYMNSKGFYAGISGLYYSEFTPNWDYFSGNLGYGKNFGKNKKFRWGVSYAHYFYSEDVNNPFENSVAASIGFVNKKKNLGTKLSFTYLFGSDNSYQSTAIVYGVINLLKNKQHDLKLRPKFEVLIGKQTIELARTITIGNQQFTRYIENDAFGLINTQLNIPIQYTINSFDFELGYSVNFPSALTGESSLKTTGFFNLSMAYLFDL